MAKPHPQQISHPHPEANKSCEGCHGSGWLTIIVDDPSRLEEAGLSKPHPFVAKCDECDVFSTDIEATKAAQEAGFPCYQHGVVGASV